MQEVFEKIIEKLNSKKAYFQRFYECEGKSEHDADLNKSTQLAFDDAIEIVKQEAEKYNNGWILCSERLPEDGTEVLVCDKEGYISSFTCNITEHRWTSGYYVAWQPSLKPPYQPKGE